MEFLLLLTIFTIAFVIGIIASMTGLGGGFLIVPVLSLLFDIPIKVAIGTSTLVITFVGLSASVGYFRKNLINLRLILPLAIGVVFGAQIGALLTTPISEGMLERMIGVVFIAISIFMYNKREDTVKQEYLISNPLLLCSGSLIGVYSGLFGMGGGVFMVPLLSFIGAPITLSIASSASVTFFAGLSGASRHLMLEQVDLVVGLFASLGVILGAQIGPAIAIRLQPKTLKIVFSLIIGIIGFVMLIAQ
ncbi:MAG: sulfite exporter TauE/SafE family protein [Halobacteriota archaeon]|nr:sulfite exporter TauE/SafE family protein [Halobacteriota archaeon]